MSAVLPHLEITPQRPHWLAGAPGFEPGNGGIKIRKRPLICKGFPVSCCICVALGKECAPCRPPISAEAVWNAHPGSHATWRLRLPGREGTKCWFARGSTNQQVPRIRQVVDSPRGTRADPRTDGQAKGASSQVKPSAGPDESPHALAPTERAPLSILIWGAPMRMDATWEDIFTRRERRAE